MLLLPPISSINSRYTAVYSLAFWILATVRGEGFDERYIWGNRAVTLLASISDINSRYTAVYWGSIRKGFEERYNWQHKEGSGRATHSSRFGFEFFF